MCGRYAASAGNDDLIEEFDVAIDHTDEPVRSLLRSPQDPPPGAADHNIAPSKNVRVVLERPDATAGGVPVRQLRLLTWGLVPSWAKDPSVGVRMTNARAETVLDKPAYRRAARARRALVPADGWYEWQAAAGGTSGRRAPKQPFFIHRRDDTPLAFAGLYEFWKDPNAADDDPSRWLTTMTIVTTSADPDLAEIHDRQPLVLEPELWEAWLDPHLDDADEVAALLAFSHPGRFDAYPVGRAVGSSSANGPSLRDPLPAT
ncbi:MAG: SOS response-associated peptidase [Mobilicoccus sp.]|nr:SOS response-associated peptidase [Mobilicoccus sp.]